jgi:hypothetical protein
MQMESVAALEKSGQTASYFVPIEAAMKADMAAAVA